MKRYSGVKPDVFNVTESAHLLTSSVTSNMILSTPCCFNNTQLIYFRCEINISHRFVYIRRKTMADSRRTEMTKLLFRTALIELMQEKPFHKITIKEICAQADLNRTTFYLHYSDQTQLLNDIVARLEEETSKHFISGAGNGDDIENLIKHLEYIKDNEKIYRTLMGGNLDDSIRVNIFKNMLSDMNVKNPEWTSRVENPYVQIFIIYGCGSAVFRWIENGFDLDTRSLAKLLYSLGKSVPSEL